MTDTDGGLSAEQLETWIVMIALMETLPAAVEAQLKRDVGVNLFEYTVLAMLSEHPDRTLQMSALAAVSFGSLSRLSHTVTRLQKRGWVEKRVGDRHNTVSLTDDGFEALATAAPAHIAEVRRLVVEPLTADELRVLSSVAKKLVGAAAPEVMALLHDEMQRVLEHNRAAPADSPDGRA